MNPYREIIQEVRRIVREVFSVTDQELDAPTRGTVRISDARMAGMVLLRSRLPNDQQVAAVFGRSRHTVIHAFDRHLGLMATDRNYKNLFDQATTAAALVNAL